MEKHNETFLGVDLGDKFSEVCVLDHAGAVLKQERVRTTRRSLGALAREYVGAVVVIEVGAHSRWVGELFTDAGLRVTVANARQVKLIWKRRVKTDRSDALLLARLARMDLNLLAPVQHRSHSAQVDLGSIRSRDALVRARTCLINHVRGTLKHFGIARTQAKTNAFSHRVPDTIPDELMPALAPVLRVLEVVTEQIRVHDKQIDELAAASSTAQRLMTIPGVGPVTAVAFERSIEDPSRFTKSRVVGAFIGLTPRKDQSGESDPRLGISKAGDPYLRRLLVQCAHYVLGPHGPESPLKRWGRAIAERNGTAGRKKAVVAVARKLATVMHRIWISEEPYDARRVVAVPT